MGEQEMKWQPIETAPIDGTHVLIFCPSYREDDGDPSGIFEGVFFPDEEWCYVPDPKDKRGSFCDLMWEPTHWMPLPNAPTAEAT